MKPMMSLELDDEAQFDSPVLTAISKDKPRFPYGLRISLENAQLATIGLDPADCCVGGMIHIHGLARITSVSQNDTEGGQNSRVELQIEQMCCVESEDEENEEAEDEMEGRAARRRKLYDRRDE
jgi:hypothetical protein